jgi:beta-N-acetylhexosaminidase
MHLRELRRHAGRFVIVGFSGDSVSADLRRLVRAFDIGGVVYAQRNLVEPRQIADLSRELGALAIDWPLWISVEHEGGTRMILPAPFTSFPAACTLGRSGDDGLAARYASALASELSAVGINFNFAPVLDVVTGSNRALEPRRALADREDTVTRLGRTVVRTFHQTGVAACAKHFPGCGNAVMQRDDEPAVVDESPDKLRAVDLRPFAAAIDEKITSIMIGSALVPAIDEHLPASLSKGIVSDMLKQEHGFGGIAVADLAAVGRFNLSAVGDASVPVSVAAIQAGCDVLLIADDAVDTQVEAIEAIIRAGESGVIVPGRLDDAWTRQRSAKERLAELTRAAHRAPVDVVGCVAHQRIADEMSEWA